VIIFSQRRAIAGANNRHRYCKEQSGEREQIQGFDLAGNRSVTTKVYRHFSGTFIEKRKNVSKCFHELKICHFLSVDRDHKPTIILKKGSIRIVELEISIKVPCQKDVQ
jgi:hypothetical protein